jgi:hypothetical protein
MLKFWIAQYVASAVFSGMTSAAALHRGCHEAGLSRRLPGINQPAVNLAFKAGATAGLVFVIQWGDKKPVPGGTPHPWIAPLMFGVGSAVNLADGAVNLRVLPKCGGRP